jgi:hypothetical protein
MMRWCCWMNIGYHSIDLQFGFLSVSSHGLSLLRASFDLSLFGARLRPCALSLQPTDSQVTPTTTTTTAQFLCSFQRTNCVLWKQTMHVNYTNYNRVDLRRIICIKNGRLIRMKVWINKDIPKMRRTSSTFDVIRLFLFMKFSFLGLAYFQLLLLDTASFVFISMCDALLDHYMIVIDRASCVPQYGHETLVCLQSTS